MAKKFFLRGKIRIWKSSDEANCIPWRMLAVLSLVSLLLIVIAVCQPFAPAVYVFLYEWITVIYPLLLAFVCIKGSFRIFNPSMPGRRSGRRFSPFLLGMSLSIMAYAQIIFLLYFLLNGHEAPYLSLPYLLMFAIYPFLIAATLLLPSRSISPLARLRILLDSLIIIVAVATFCYYFVLAPILRAGDGALTEKIVGVLFPSADLVVLFCLLLVALRSGEPALRPVLGMLGLAFCIIFLVHVNRLHEVLNLTLHWVEPLSVAWAPALMFVLGAAQTIKNILKRDEVAGYTAVGPTVPPGAFFSANRWKSLLALSLALGMSLVIFLLWLGGVKGIFQGQVAIIYVGGFIVLMLVVLRQLLAMYEISLLQARLYKRNCALHHLNDLLEKQATTDSLTGLPNHRELMAKLNNALVMAQETTSPFAIIFMDLDNFKSINDLYGHLVGDTVLCEFGKLVSLNLHAEDYLGRWGGEEFVVILPGVERVEAFKVAEKIRVAVERSMFAGEQGVHLTCSLGVATYPCNATRREDLLMNADRAMYTAKRLGRNQTRTSSEPLVLAMGMLADAPETVEEVEMLAVVESLIMALEARDRYTSQHARRVAALSLKLALALGLDWSNACIVGMGGLLHDLGKVAMPDAILFKHGKLTPAEIEYMALHPLIGEKILTPLPSLRPVAVIVRAHHEWFNGSGYPNGLQGENIPLGSRIVAVADTYDAIISHRIYRQGRVSSEAVSELRKGAGKQFDAEVVKALEYLLAASPGLSVINAA